jgi:proline iminopeptidase
MADHYAPIEPYERGMLKIGEGHELYWEACGAPAGKPALVLHGGPGSGCSPSLRRYFDPEVYRVVLFDQRGAGRSTPHASEPNIDLSANTTAHLLRDIERLRCHLGLERWLVFGQSWGSTLALAYAEAHPQCVTEMVLAGVGTTTAWEVEWFTRGVDMFFPEAWARFRGGVPKADRAGSLVEAYHRLLMDPDPAIHEKAARDWCDWEAALQPHPRYEQATFRLGFARLVTHYWRHQAWFEEGVLLREAHRLAGIPGILIHGRLDLGSPPITAWRLTQHWPGSELVIVSEAGHDPGRESVVAALDRFGAGK